MARTRRGRPHTGTRLMLAYALISLVPVLALGVVLVRGEQQAGLDRGLAQGRAQAAVIVQMAIAPALDDRDLSDGVSAQELARLHRATDLAVFSGSLTHLRLRSFTGQVVFSDDGSTAGALPSDQPAFRTAAGGGVDVAVVPSPTMSGQQVIRVLQPVIPNASGQATGVLELYLPYSPIAATVDAEQHSTYLRMAGGLVALYVVLAVISWSSSRRLRRYAAEQQHQALHDPLTGLPNREVFRQRADDVVSEGLRGQPGAIVLMDLDRFKDVNDTLGHHAGDELLRVVAQRLIACVRTDDTVARLGGDEFGLVLTGTAQERDVTQLLERVRAALAEDVCLDGELLAAEASFGVAMCPEHGTTTESLLRNADAAMYQGKRGTAGIVVYRPGMASQPRHWLAVHGERESVR